MLESMKGPNWRIEIDETNGVPVTRSFIISCVESYEMASRQIRWMARILPAHWEMMFLDDGSDPPISVPSERPANFRLIRTGEVRVVGEWTHALAMNNGIAEARGEYIVKDDVDHVFTQRAIEIANEFRGDAMLFRRSAGYLSEDLEMRLLTWEEFPHHVYSTVDDIWICRRQLFLDIGGYPPFYHRLYGQFGSVLHPYTLADSQMPPPDARIYWVPEQFAKYHHINAYGR